MKPYHPCLLDIKPGDIIVYSDTKQKVIALSRSYPYGDGSNYLAYTGRSLTYPDRYKGQDIIFVVTAIGVPNVTEVIKGSG